MKTFEDLVSEIMASESHQAFMNDPNQLMEAYVPEGQSEGIAIVKVENNIYICPIASKPVKVVTNKEAIVEQVGEYDYCISTKQKFNVYTIE